MSASTTKKSDAKAEAKQPAKQGRKPIESKLTGEQIAALRDEGMKWTDIVVECGLPEGSSAIPLRNLMYKALGKQTKARTKKAMGEDIVRMRDIEGHGWPRISSAMGLSAKDARQLYTDAGGKSVDGRVYVRTEGSGDKAKQVTSLRVDSTHGTKADKPRSDQGEDKPAKGDGDA